MGVPGLRGKMYPLGTAALALLMWFPLLSFAQNPPPDQKTPKNPTPPASEKQPAAPANPQEPPPGQLKLENPEAPPAPPPQTQEIPKLSNPTAPVAPPAPEVHKPTIDSIIIRGNRRIPAMTLRARLFSHPGDVYDEAALERDFMALWNTGFLDDVRLEVADAPNGNKIVTFYVREKKLVRSIDYKGLSSVEQSDVLDAFKKEKVGLSIESQYDPVVIKHAEVVLHDLLAAHGKMFATVRHRTRNIPPNSVALTFIIVEGPKVKLGDIKFSGNTVFSDFQLVRAMKYSRPSGAPPGFIGFIRPTTRTGSKPTWKTSGIFTAIMAIFMPCPKILKPRWWIRARSGPSSSGIWGRGSASTSRSESKRVRNTGWDHFIFAATSFFRNIDWRRFWA